MGRQQRGVHRPARQLRAAETRAAAVGVHDPVARAEQDVVHAVAVQVREPRRGLAVGGEAAREAGQRVGVLVQEGAPAVLAGAIVVVAHPDADHEREPVRVAVAGRDVEWPARGRVPERRAQACDRDRAEHPVACRVEPAARAQRVHLRLERRFVRRPEAGRARILDRPAPDRHLVAVGARMAGVHPAPHHEPAVGRRDDRVPVGIGDLGLGRDAPAGHRAHHAVRVHPAVAEVLVVAGDRGEAPARDRLAGGEVRGRRRRLRRQEVDVVGRHGEQLADLVGGQPSPGVAGGRVEQPRHPGRLAGGLR